MNPEKTVAFTGHRPEKIRDGQDENSVSVLHIKFQLRQAILEMIDKGCTCFLSGMAMGTDLWAAEIVLDLKKQYPYLRLAAVIPFPGQSNLFSKEWKHRYLDILSRCDESHIITPQRQSNSFMLRNKWLVDHAAHVIGVYHGGRSGTMQTLNMALLNGSDVKIIHC